MVARIVGHSIRSTQRDSDEEPLLSMVARRDLRRGVELFDLTTDGEEGDVAPGREVRSSPVPTVPPHGTLPTWVDDEDRIEPASPPNEELLDCLEQDLAQRTRRRVCRSVQDSDSDEVPLQQVNLPNESRNRMWQRRVVLVPQDGEGTPRSIQGVEPNTVPASDPASTVPASAGALQRRLFTQSMSSHSPIKRHPSRGIC